VCVRRSFKSSLTLGARGEQRLIDVLAGARLPCRRNESADLVGWDVAFEFGGEVVRVEVKHDLYAAKSGNLAVEYYNPRAGKPSGILATKSRLWCVVLADGVYLGRTADLKAYFETKPCVRDVACGGDGNAAMRLYRAAELLPAVFRRVDGRDSTQAVLTIIKELLG
jgi:hypothetical protein